MRLAFMIAILKKTIDYFSDWLLDFIYDVSRFNNAIESTELYTM